MAPDLMASAIQVRYLHTVSLVPIASLVECRFSLREELGNIDDLSSSVKRHGILNPIIVRPKGEQYEIVAGNRRVAASRKAGLKDIPCFIYELSDREAYEFALVENVQRKSLNAIEEAVAFRHYTEQYGWGGVTALSKRIGKSEVYVSHRLLLLKLPDDVKKKVSTRVLSPSIAKQLVWLSSENAQVELAQESIRHGLTVRQIRKAIGVVNSGGDTKTAIQSVYEEPEFSKHRKPAKHELLHLYEQGVLSFRYSLNTLDLILESIKEKREQEWLRNNLLERRYSIHQLIDVLLREKHRVLRRETQSLVA
ncbi:MAG: ParB/RepB/Spo0J family partition protein [Nitrososphaerota archaeon]|nr:ParB/RepB/Spo0J family partition protein [Nitrososphaerota archaeon]